MDVKPSRVDVECAFGAQVSRFLLFLVWCLDFFFSWSDFDSLQYLCEKLKLLKPLLQVASANRDHHTPTVFDPEKTQRINQIFSTTGVSHHLSILCLLNSLCLILCSSCMFWLLTPFHFHISDSSGCTAPHLTCPISCALSSYFLDPYHCCSFFLPIFRLPLFLL